MTIGEAIAAIDELKPNQYSRQQKIGWLNQADGLIYKEIIQTHEGADGVFFYGYDQNTDDCLAMIIPTPYDQAYIHWLESRIDYANQEYGKYNNSNTTWLADLGAFRDFWNATHLPVATRVKYW